MTDPPFHPPGINTESIVFATAFRIHPHGRSDRGGSGAGRGSTFIILGTAVTEPDPLSRGYNRENEVLADIAALERLDDDAFWRRASIRDYQQPGCPRLETLVYFVRSCARSGRADEAWRIVEILTRRVTPTITNRLARVYGISRDQVDDLYEDVIGDLYEEWVSDEPAHEFWEVRFSVCLERKVIDAIKRHRRIRENEITLAVVSEEGAAMDPLEQMPDLAALDPEMAATVRAALDSLPEPLRTAFFMAEFGGFTEEAIAEHLGVTSRTIRNYLVRVRKLLEPWREE